MVGMTFRGSLAIALAAGFAAFSGCILEGTGRSDAMQGDSGVAPYYTRYFGPARAISGDYRSYERITFTEQGGDYDPAISRDGTRMIYASTVQSVEPHIFMKTVAGPKANITTRTQLTGGAYAEIQPCFSPDGKSIAYASNRRGNWDILLQAVDGSGRPLQLTSEATDEIAPDWHPSGQWIAFSKFNPRTLQWMIAVRNISTHQLKELGEGLFPKFSPDGKRIAFQRPRERAPRWYSVWVIDVDEDFNCSLPTEVVSSAKWAAINPAWSPDGRYLTFATVNESPEAQSCRRILMGDDIWMVNINGQDLIKLTDSVEPESHPFWSPAGGKNGRIFFCSMQAGPKNIWALSPRVPEPYGSYPGPLPGPAAEHPVAVIPEKAPETVEAPPVHKAPEPVKSPEPAKTPEPVKAPEPVKTPEPIKLPAGREPNMVPPVPPAATSKSE